MLTDFRWPGWRAGSAPAEQVFALLALLAVAIVRVDRIGFGADGWQAALGGTLQCALAAGAYARLFGHARVLTASLLAGMLALVAFAAFPRGALIATAAVAHAAIYGALVLIFARSLRPGQTPIATALARRIHPQLTPRRRAYTKVVTGIWAVYFIAQLSASVPLALWEAGGTRAARLANAADLPIAGLLLAVELAIRTVWFRGERHGSLTEMLRALTPAWRVNTLKGPPV